MRKCIINLATRERDKKGQERLRDSIYKMGFDGDFLAFTSESEIGAPAHSDIPYAFKAYAFEYARNLGYDLVLWCDSALWAVKDISPVFEHIEKKGYLLYRNGWTSGEWCADSALQPLGITREQSFEYPHLMACQMGLNFNDEKANEFFNEYFRMAKEGTSFKGAWSNENFECSTNPKVLGHRHDQTVGSIIAWDLGMWDWQIPHETYLLYYNGQHVPENIIFLSQGMY